MSTNLVQSRDFGTIFESRDFVQRAIKNDPSRSGLELLALQGLQLLASNDVTAPNSGDIKFETALSPPRPGFDSPHGNHERRDANQKREG